MRWWPVINLHLRHLGEQQRHDHGALDVLLERRLADRVVTVGADADRNACEAIVAGQLWADIDKMPYELGRAAYEACLQIIRRETPVSDRKATNGTVEVAVRYTPVRIITKDYVKQEMAYRWKGL